MDILIGLDIVCAQCIYALDIIRCGHKFSFRHPYHIQYTNGGDKLTKALKLRDFLLLFWLFVFFPTVNSRWVWLKKKGNIVTLQNKLRQQAFAEWWWWQQASTIEIDTRNSFFFFFFFFFTLSVSAIETPNSRVFVGTDTESQHQQQKCHNRVGS